MLSSSYLIEDNIFLSLREDGHKALSGHSTCIPLHFSSKNYTINNYGIECNFVTFAHKGRSRILGGIVWIKSILILWTDVKAIWDLVSIKLYNSKIFYRK